MTGLAGFHAARPHSSLEYVTPATFVASLKPQWLSALPSMDASAPIAIADSAQTLKFQSMFPVAGG